jgi:HSP20 family protein
MSINLMKKNTGQVEQSLEATRSIEYQLLNMKEEMQKYSDDGKKDDSITPAVSHTLETLLEIDSQLQTMRTMLETYSDALSEQNRGSKASKKPVIIDKPNPEPNGPTSPPTFPRTYPETISDHPPHAHPKPDYKYPQPRPMPPWEHQRMAEPYYYPPPPNPYMYYPPPQYYGHRYYAPYYGDPKVYPQDYPPFFNLYEEYSRERPRENPGYYQSADYPTAASSEPAYSKKVKGIPSQVFNIAYYPWEQITGRKGPTSSRTPYINLYDLGGEYLMFVELPGVEKEDIEIRVDEQSIWINGKPTILGGGEGTPIVQEHGYHEFFRQLTLPSNIVQNKTQCTFDNGILIIKLKKEAPAKPAHKVKIK